MFRSSALSLFVATLSVAAATLLPAQTASAATVVLIDLNENAGAGSGPGGTWNTYANPLAITGSTVVDFQNLSTPITLSISGIVADNTANGGLVVFDPSLSSYPNQPTWVAAGGNNNASGDNFFTNNSNTVADSYTLTFGNLTPGNVVDLDLLASRNSAAAFGYFEYSLDGSTWFGFTVLNGDGSLALTDGWNTKTTGQGAGGQVYRLQSQGYAQHRYLNASDLTLTGTTFSVRTTDGDAVNTTFSAINAVRLTVVPEPASAVLLIGAGVALFGIRRRRA